MINRLLALKLIRFTKKQLTDTLSQTSNKSEGQINLMISYKLIKEEEILSKNNERIYEIVDPKVQYLIKRSVSLIEN